MDMFTYIADSDPQLANALIKELGFSTTCVRTKTDLGKCLRLAAIQRGEAGMKYVAMNHPDKDIIIEATTKTQQPEGYHNADGAVVPDNSNKSDGCSCKKCCSGGSGGGREHMYMNADASTTGALLTMANNNNQSTTAANIFSMALIGGTILLAVAIITNKSHA